MTGKIKMLQIRSPFCETANQAEKYKLGETYATIASA